MVWRAQLAGVLSASIRSGGEVVHRSLTPRTRAHDARGGVVGIALRGDDREVPGAYLTTMFETRDKRLADGSVSTVEVQPVAPDLGRYGVGSLPRLRSR